MPNLHTLLPTDIEKGSPQHEAVDRLKEALANDNVYNIAITGAYGSGKSSVITTFLHENKDDKKVKDKYCTISLATIEALNDIEEEKGQGKVSEVKATEEQGSEGKTADDQKARTDKATEAKLNRRIEYSILQQLIYKEKHTKLPKSRFKKIPFISKIDAEKYSFWTVSCIISWLIVFEPKAFRIDSLYTYFENTFGILNFVFDWIATIWLIVCACVLSYKIIRHYSGLSLKKISVANADIDIDEERSVFNDYLEEIIYFFQETKYNIVFIEDLDRFDSTYIFLKLRELNTLLNRSNILKASSSSAIRFVYAIRDDLFVDSGRTKFFDEIIPVIPVVNPSNAAEKLKESLEHYGLKDKVSNDDLTDMAYFIKDMRLLKNIANEFYLYYRMLKVEENHLDSTKLLAMMIYKNLHPKDFGKLPNREGVLYTILSREYKGKFIEYAKDKAIAERRKYWKKQKEIKDNTQVHNEIELRRLYLLSFYKLNNFRLDTTIRLGNDFRNFDDIANDEDLFIELTQLKHCSHNYYDSYYGSWKNSSIDIVYATAEKNVDSKFTYKERSKALGTDYDYINQMLAGLDIEENRLGTYRVKDFLNKFPEVTKTDWYETLHVPYLIEFFLRRGFLDEDFYDYVSYHYNGISTDQDHDTLMRLKSGQTIEYTRPVDDVRSLIKNLPKKIFSKDSSLINVICDAILVDNWYNEVRDLFLNNLYNSQKSVEFLKQYLQLGKYPDELFDFYVNHNQEKAWKEFTSLSQDTIRRDLVREWIKVVDIDDDKELCKEAIKWIRENYPFISNEVDYIGIDKVKNLILKAPIYFTELTPSNPSLLDFICNNDRYVMNTNNLSVLADQYNEKETITSANLNLTRIFSTPNEALVKLTKTYINDVLKSISPTAKDEVESSMLYVLNHEKIKVEDKQKFLEGQINKISKISDITAVADQRIAIMTNVLAPTWDNIEGFLVNATNDDKKLLDEFISKNVALLSNAGSTLDVDNSDELFNKIINSDLISDDGVYSQLLEAFEGYTMSSQIYPQTKSTRLVMLIEKGVIPCSEEHKSQIKSIDDIAYSHYLEYNWNQLAGGLKESDLTDTSILYLLQSSNLSASDKSVLITKIPVQIVLKNAEVASEVSKALFINYQFVSYPFMYSVISNSTDDEYRLPVAIATIQHAIENKDGDDVIIEVIKSLGGHYTELLDNSKKPTYENSTENYRLLLLLRQCNIISSFKEEDGKRYRVYHSHKGQP
jgi:hypothetical protein